jgi:hypothetical protein
MTSFDATYANEYIDYITTTSNNMVKLYNDMNVNSSFPQESVRQLTNMFVSVIQSIDKYYKYLEKTGVTPEESYLTKWLETAYSPEYFDDIEYFLETYSH